MVFFFFFQAEDGIRDIGVTGVQTCALPIYARFDKIEALRPDLVLAFSDLQADLAAELVRRGIAVAIFNQRSVDEILQMKIGRASCRERVEISVVAVTLKKKNEQLQLR